MIYPHIYPPLVDIEITMEKLSKIIFLGAIVIVFVAIFLIRSRGSQFRDKVYAAVSSGESCVERNIPVREVLGLSTGDVCVQASYAMKEGFEAKTGKKAPGFSVVDDTQSVIWVYQPGEQPKTIHVPRSVAGWKASDSDQICWPINQATLVVYCEGNIKRYSIKEGK